MAYGYQRSNRTKGNVSRQFYSTNLNSPCLVQDEIFPNQIWMKKKTRTRRNFFYTKLQREDAIIIEKKTKTLYYSFGIQSSFLKVILPHELIIWLTNTQISNLWKSKSMESQHHILEILISKINSIWTPIVRRILSYQANYLVLF